MDGCPVMTMVLPEVMLSAIHRLLESTFRLDVKTAREYCEADERWLGAVAFLDNDGGAGWDLLGAMLSPQWRQRPTAESCLNHPFLKKGLA
jgi:hypothetical protein